MGQLQDRMIEDLTLRGSAPATTSAYVRYARAFVAFHRRSPAELGEEHVRAWLLHLLKEQRRSPRTVNVHIAALRVLFNVTLRRPEVMANVRHVRPQHRQPTIPSGQQVRALLDAAPSLTVTLPEACGPNVLDDLRRALLATNRVVYAKAPFGGAAQVYAYHWALHPPRRDLQRAAAHP